MLALPACRAGCAEAHATEPDASAVTLHDATASSVDAEGMKGHQACLSSLREVIPSPCAQSSRSLSHCVAGGRWYRRHRTINVFSLHGFCVIPKWVYLLCFAACVCTS